MSVNVDAVNERLNGLVTLLKAVGVDSLGPDGKGGTSSKSGGIPDARQLDDDQIEAIIKKLQMAQSEAPQIIAALEAQAREKKQMQQQQQQKEHATQKTGQQEQQEEEEDDDSFDEDANYPMVGQGVSDDVSIMSDLTTPTVLVGVAVPEEEHYRDTLPPMIVGGNMVIQQPKRKNLVGAVRSSNQIQPPRRGGTGSSSKNGSGGAAAQRRKHYNATMEKLAHDPPSNGAPATPHRPKKPQKIISPTPSSSSNGTNGAQRKKSSSTGRRASLNAAPNSGDWASGSNSSWNAFENTSSTRKKKSATLIDDNGFLMDGGFDPFNTAPQPNKNTFGQGSTSGSATGSGKFSSNSSGEKESSKHRRKKKSSSSSRDGSSDGLRSNENLHNSRNSNGSKPSTSSSSKPRRSRRASLAM